MNARTKVIALRMMNGEPPPAPKWVYAMAREIIALREETDRQGILIESLTQRLRIAEGHK
jgi:hypothetical protein